MVMKWRKWAIAVGLVAIVLILTVTLAPIVGAEGEVPGEYPPLRMRSEVRVERQFGTPDLREIISYRLWTGAGVRVEPVLFEWKGTLELEVRSPTGRSTKMSQPVSIAPFSEIKPPFDWTTRDRGLHILTARLYDLDMRLVDSISDEVEVF